MINNTLTIPFYIDPVSKPDFQVQRICSYTDTRLVENTLPATFICPYCSAEIGETHTRICPHGERYAQAKEIRDAAKSLGKLGGQSRSPAKSISSRENGKKGGRPKGRRDKKNTINLDIFG